MNRNTRIFYPINDQIKDNELRVVDNNGENLGVMNRYDALKKAEEMEIDLVLISPSAKPPVAKLIDYNKFIYEQQKKAAEQRKGRKVGLKELQFKPNIDDHDITIRVNRAIEFLKAGNKVKFTIKFFGRMQVNKQIGYDKMGQIVERLKVAGEVESGPSMEGNFMVTYIKPNWQCQKRKPIKGHKKE